MSDYSPNYQLTKQDIKNLKTADFVCVMLSHWDLEPSLHRGRMALTFEHKDKGQYGQTKASIPVNTLIFDATLTELRDSVPNGILPGIKPDRRHYQAYDCCHLISRSLSRETWTSLLREGDILLIEWSKESNDAPANPITQCFCELVIYRNNRRKYRLILGSTCGDSRSKHAMVELNRPQFLTSDIAA